MFNRNKIAIVSDAICGILIILSILAYILIGLFAHIWHPTWIIIVITCAVDAVVSIIIGTIIKLKSDKPKQKNE